MHYTAEVTGEGLIVIPIDVREQLGLREGDKVKVVIEREEPVRSTPSDSDVFAKYVGILDDHRTIEEIVRQERIDRGRIDS